MRFKDFLQEDGGAATSGMHGGIYDMPSAYTNVNMPVQSKYVTKDGDSDQHEIPCKHTPDQIFGFRNPKDKKQTREREANIIDKKRGPQERIPPDTIY